MIVLLGKSGSGKDSVQQLLGRMGVSKVVPYTTRPMRNREIDGVTYHFIDNTEFFERLQNHEFAVWNMYSVETGEQWCYGILEKDLSKHCCVQINPYWIQDMKDRTEHQPLLFYLSVDSQIQTKRLQKRGGNLQEAYRRMSADERDFRGVAEKADVVLPSDKGLTAKEEAELIYAIHQKLVK